MEIRIFILKFIASTHMESSITNVFLNLGLSPGEYDVLDNSFMETAEQLERLS